MELKASDIQKQRIKELIDERLQVWQCGIRGVAATSIARDVNTVTFIKAI